MAKDKVGTYCCRPWCYVDPSTCDGLTTPFYPSFVQAGGRNTLFYSYVACDKNPNATRTYPTADACPFEGPNDFTPDVSIFATVRDFGEDTHPHFGCSKCQL